jgi:hypothetical protein
MTQGIESEACRAAQVGAKRLTVVIVRKLIHSYEREIVFMQAAKARGVVLGPRLADVRSRAVANLKADADRAFEQVI